MLPRRRVPARCYRRTFPNFRIRRHWSIPGMTLPISAVAVEVVPWGISAVAVVVAGDDIDGVVVAQEVPGLWRSDPHTLTRSS